MPTILRLLTRNLAHRPLVAVLTLATMHLSLGLATVLSALLAGQPASAAPSGSKSALVSTAYHNLSIADPGT